MNTYNSFHVKFRGRPFINVLASGMDEVEQFLADWCASNNIRPQSDEWSIDENIPAVVSRDVVDQIAADTGIAVGGGAARNKFACTPGDVGRVIPNSKMWG